jgi:hypothetical protein
LTTKVCFKCGTEKPLDDFYRHKMMADGHLGKCKECTKSDVRGNRAARIDYYKAYDVERMRRPERRAAFREYGRAARERYPEKRRAHNAVSHAIRDGRLKRLPCRDCGDPKTDGHHEDYSKPLEVIWLCRQCHHNEHARLRARSA